MEVQEEQNEYKTELKKEDKKRNINLDIIRCIAIFSVISVHFFLKIDFYNTPIVGKRMYLMSIMRTFFMICVPLFLLLTGYLMNKKTMSKRYYWGIHRILVIYVLASICCILLTVFYLKKEVGFKQTIWSILDFSAAPYSWYINMYIGLFLLIPFLNILYWGLEKQKYKQWLICTLLLLTMFPSICNTGWWTALTSGGAIHQVVPDWWGGIYPITYYYIGAYLKEYDWKLGKKLNLFLLVGAVLLFGTLNFYRSYGVAYVLDTFTAFEGAQSVCIAVLLFVFIKHLNCEKVPRWLNKIIVIVSEVSMGTYLLSWIFDMVVYSKINQMVPYIPNRLEYYVIAVPCVFVASTLLSYVIHAIYNGGVLLCRSIKKSAGL
ncbi:MAG: acyltransferase family protein [Lachnospiraceae bacterium]